MPAHPATVYPAADSDGESPFAGLLRLLFATFLSIVAALLVYLTAGSLFVVPGIVVAAVCLVLLVRHLELGVYFLLGAAIFVEQFHIFGLDNIPALKIPLYLNLNLVTGIGALVFNPIEALLGLMVLIWLLRAATSRQWRLRSIPGIVPTVLFLAVLAGYVVFGLARGGQFTVALWEVRALFYLLGVFFIATQVLYTRRHITICLWIIAVALGVKGLQGCWRFFVTLGGHLGDIPAITGHEDALFLSTGFILLLACVLQGVRGRLVWFLALTTPATLLTFIVTQRRIAYGTLSLSSIITVLYLPRRARLLALKCAVPLALAGVIYTATFWNSSSTVALPIQQARSVFATGSEADSSNTYRDVENFNLQQTIRSHPVGVGFGKKYLIILPLAEVEFPLWDYIPHNCIYWMWAKTGWIGFIIFWLFFGSLLTRLSIDVRNTRDPRDRALLLMVLTFVFSQVVIAYYDLQITFYRNMIYLGVALAMWTAVRNLQHGPHRTTQCAESA